MEFRLHRSVHARRETQSYFSGGNGRARNDGTLSCRVSFCWLSNAAVAASALGVVPAAFLWKCGERSATRPAGMRPLFGRMPSYAHWGVSRVRSSFPVPAAGPSHWPKRL